MDLAVPSESIEPWSYGHMSGHKLRAEEVASLPHPFCIPFPLPKDMVPGSLMQIILHSGTQGHLSTGINEGPTPSGRITARGNNLYVESLGERPPMGTMQSRDIFRPASRLHLATVDFPYSSPPASVSYMQGHATEGDALAPDELLASPPPPGSRHTGLV